MRAHLFAKLNGLPYRWRTGADNNWQIGMTCTVECIPDSLDSQGTFVMGQVSCFSVGPLEDQSSYPCSGKSIFISQYGLGFSLIKRGVHLSAWAASASRSKSCFLSSVNTVIRGA